MKGFVIETKVYPKKDLFYSTINKTMKIQILTVFSLTLGLVLTCRSTRSFQDGEEYKEKMRVLELYQKLQLEVLLSNYKGTSEQEQELIRKYTLTTEDKQELLRRYKPTTKETQELIRSTIEFAKEMQEEYRMWKETTKEDQELLRKDKGTTKEDQELLGSAFQLNQDKSHARQITLMPKNRNSREAKNNLEELLSGIGNAF